MVTKQEKKEKFSRIVKSYRDKQIVSPEDREWILEQCRQTSYFRKKASNPAVKVWVKIDKIGMKRGKYLFLDKMPVTKSRLFAPKKRNKDKFDSSLVLRALRLTVKDQLSKYKRENLGENSMCPGCGKHLSHPTCTVDHKSKPFSTILEDWLQIEETSLEKIRLAGRGNARKLKDPLQAVSWAKYHEKNCDFQLMCRSCNSSKGNK